MVELLDKTRQRKAETKALQTYLGVYDRPEDDLISLRDCRVGSQACSWIESREYYTQWRDSQGYSQILWLRARPAFGKSVLASYIVDNVTALGHDCNYFFFAHGQPSKSSVGAFLRSIAYQMALAPGNGQIKDTLLALQAEEVQFEHDDEQSIWRKLFMAGIFRTTFRPHSPQYWVIDGIDECKNPDAVFGLLAKIPEITNLRILVTGRDSSDLVKSSAGLKSRLLCKEISVEDTKKDIEAYTNEKVAQLSLDDEVTSRYVERKVLEKSLGCFLWVKLVLRELDDVHMRSSIEQILEEVPEGMDPLYARTLETMSRHIHGNSKSFVQAILAWTMCATRPLSVSELQNALQLDIGEEVYRLRQAITSLCSQLVYIDGKDLVQPVHQTAREYLLLHTDSEWSVSRAKGSARIVETCLQYLTSQEMAVPRNRRGPSLHTATPEKSPFAPYACAAWSQHLRVATASSDSLLINLAKFLQSNVLAWVDHVAKIFRSLHHLTQAAKNLKLFLDRRAKYKSPLGKEFSITDAWSVDLDRIATKFGRSLLSSPSAIYWLVPAFCPLQSAIRKQFGQDPRGIEVLGVQSMSWDDRISCMIHRGKRPSSLACADTIFAVGFSEPPGLIILYNMSTCQELRRLMQPESVRNLSFSSTGELLASSGVEAIYVFSPLTNINDPVFVFSTVYEPLSICFSQNDAMLIAAAEGNHTISWDLRDGLEQELCTWTDADGFAVSQNVPSVVVFNQERSILAAFYKGYPISLWEVEGNNFLGYLYRDQSQLGELRNPRGIGRTAAHPHVEAMVFNPKTDQLISSYADGEVCCFDAWSQELETQENAFIQTLACSPDGRTLAGGDAHGTIQLRDFRTLRLLYKVVAFDDPIRRLTFSGNSLRLLDIRGSTCNVWEPSILVRSEQDEDESVSDVVSRSPGIVESEDMEDINQLTAMLPGPAVIFIGKEDGAVAVYDPGTGSQIQQLYRHEHATVSTLSWSAAKNILASADFASKVIVTSLTPPTRGTKVWLCDRLFECRFKNEAIYSILLSTAGDRLLVSTMTSDNIYDIKGHLVNSQYHGGRRPLWVNHPRIRAVIGLEPGLMRIYNWENFRETDPQDSTVPSESREEHGTSTTAIKRAVIIPKTNKIIMRLITPRVMSYDTRLRFLDLTRPSQNAVTQSDRSKETISDKPLHSPVSDALSSKLDPFTHHLEQLIGTLPSSELVFLDKNLWISTIDIEKPITEYTRHFFIPHDWMTNNEDMNIQVTPQKDIVFLKRDKLVLMKRGLRTGEKVIIA